MPTRLKDPANISDEFIYLRKLEHTDLDRTLIWINRPDIFLKIGVQAPVTRQAQEKWFKETDKAADKKIIAICELESHQHIGNLSLDNIDFRHSNARFSIFIACEGARGKGFGSRALKLLMVYAFDQLGLNRIWCKTTAGDSKVINFYKKLGFHVEGNLRQHEFINDCYVDKVILGLLRNERPDRNRYP